MRAILLAAGFGTRLRPLTETVPKCLVPIKGKPLIQIWLERLSAAGIGPFLINTHHLSNRVETFFCSSPFQNQVTLIYEPKLRGTCGTLIDNLGFYEGTDGLLIHADNYCLADFSAFIQAHHQRPPECIMTMMTFRTDKPSSCGIVELDERGVVTGFHEKVTSPPGNLANGAVYILSFELLNEIARDLQDVNDFSIQLLGRLVGRIYSYETKEAFVDVGTPESYAVANSMARNIESVAFADSLRLV